MRHRLLVSATLALIAVPVCAQVAAVDEGNLEEIVVTAQKSEQKLFDVPITITTFSGKKLRDIGVTQFDQLSAFIPGLNVQEQSPNNPGFVIRGVTSDSGSSQGAPAVTVYLNGVDVSRSRGSYFDLYDLERVEAVKGPQATLFGTAAAVGAVSVITAKPQKDFAAELRAGFGNFDQRRVDGFINFGGDVFTARVAFAARTRDGVVENIAGQPGSQTPNGPEIDDLNGQGQYGARVSLRYDKDDLLIDLIGTYDGQRAPGTAFKSGTFAPTGGDTSPFTFAEVAGSPVSDAALGGPQPELVRNVYDLNLTASYRVNDGLNVTQIFGYRRFDSNEVFDADGTQAWFLEFAEDARGEQFSSETRLNYSDDNFRAFAGFNFFRETGSQRVPFSTEEGTYLQCAARLVPGLPCINAAGVVTASQATAILTRGAATVLPYSSEFKNSARITTYSAFGDVSWIVTPKLELTAGGRLLIEDRESGYFARVPNSVITRAPLLPQIDTRGQTLEAQGDFQAFLPRANILWRATDWANFYLTYSRGRRSPVVQLDAGPGGVARVNNVGEERLTNYEGGVNISAGKFSGRIALYYMDYNDFQVALVRPGLPNLTVSAGGASNKGVEAEFNYVVNANLRLFGSGNYIDAKVDVDPNFPTFSGDNFRLQSEWQGAFGVDVDVPLSSAISLFALPTVTYRSRVFFELPNNPVTTQGPVTLVNLRAGIRDPNRKWEIIGFATNLFDEEYVLDAGNTGGAFGIPTFIRGLPALFGVEGVYRF